MSRPLVAVHGSYFHENFGDILLISTYCKWIRENTGAEIVLPRANEKAREILGAEHRGMWPMRRARALVLSGGGYFSEPPTGKSLWRTRRLVLHEPPVRYARRKGMPYAIVGVGAGPISPGSIRRMIVEHCVRADLLAVRDAESQQFLVEYGVPAEKILVTADSALAISPSDIPATAIIAVDKFLATLPPGPKIGVHLDLSHAVSHLGDSFAVDLAKVQSEHPGATMVCFYDANYTLHGPNKSGPFFSAIAKVSSGAPIFVPYRQPWNLAALINRLDLVFTTKLHVGIVATAFGRTAVTVPGHPKTFRFYRQTGQARRCLSPDDFSEGRLATMMSAALAGKYPTEESALAIAIEAATRNERLVAEFVKQSLG